MDLYYSTTHMLNEHIKKGWKKTETTRGFYIIKDDASITGSLTVWGNPRTACFLDSDVIFHDSFIERYYYKERGIQITFVEDMNLQYYQRKQDVSEVEFGLYCFVNNIPMPWFKRTPSGTLLKCSTIIITESFFKEASITMPKDGWDRAARIINHNKMSLPNLAAVCRQIKYAEVDDEAFSVFFRAKVIEAISIILNYTFQMEKNDAYSMTQKTHTAAKEAIKILTKNYINPPVIEDLARSVGVDKKTLQKAFKQIAGRSIHDYISCLRMEKTLSLLKDPSIRLDEIAIAVGYQSKGNFYKVFKHTYGCTPNKMRKQYTMVR